MVLIKRITNSITVSVLMALLSLPAMIIFAQEEQPRVLIRGAPERPVSGSAWVLTLLIAHNEPDEVNVLAPPFTGSLFLDQVLKGPRLVNPATGQTVAGAQDENSGALEYWTAMEYRFMLLSPGIVTMDGFTVITPAGQVKTAPVSLTVLRPQGADQRQRCQLAWENIPAGLAAGESADIELRVNGWRSGLPLPDQSLFLPPVPPGYILDPLPLPAQDKSAGIVLRLRLIPLEPGVFLLEKRQFTADDTIFEIPALRISVTRPSTAAADAVAKTAKANTALSIKNNEAAPETVIPALPFPPLEIAAINYSRIFQKYELECKTIYNTSKNLWDRGYRANALATLRKNERDHPAGILFAEIRRGAEQLLGFHQTNDEKRKNLLSIFTGKSGSAVLKETFVYQIPDAAGEKIAHCGEGQPVIVQSERIGAEENRVSWVRIITNDSGGIAGWAQEERLIFY